MAIVMIAIWLIFLQVLVKTGVFKGWALWMKLSPIGIYLLVMLAIFIPMNFGAPVGKTIAMNNSIPIVPGVSGYVTEVGDIVAKRSINADDVLFKINQVPYQAAVSQLASQLELAKIRLAQAEKLVSGKAGRVGDVQKYDAEVKSLQAQLAKAEQDLTFTEVKAPVTGRIPTVLLRPGTWVNAGQPVMRLIEGSDNILGVQIDQINLRHVEVGQKAEVILKLYPGKVFNATVVNIVQDSQAGLLTPSGEVMATKELNAAPLWVALKLEDDVHLPAGIVGQAAIFTDEFGSSHAFRKIMLRMDTWMNYLMV